MDDQQGAAAPQGPQQPGNAPEESDAGPAAALGELQKALFQVNSAMEGTSAVPKEGLMHLKNAYTEYQAFMSIASKALGVPAPDMGGQSMGNQPAETQGMSGAVPAGMPSGKGIRAVPA